MGKVKPYIAGIIILLVCLLKTPAPNAIRTYMFAVGIGTYIGLFVWLLWIDKYLGLAFGVCFASVLFNHGSTLQIATIRNLFLWFMFLTLWLEKDNIEIVLDFLCIALIFQVGFMYLQLLYGDPWAKDIKTLLPLRKPTGLVCDLNAASAFIGICTPAMFRKRWKYYLIVPVLGLIIVKSFTGVLAVLLAGLVYIYLSGRKKEALLATVIFAELGFIYSQLIDPPDIAMRLLILKKALELHWNSMMLWGVGLARFKVPILIEEPIRPLLIKESYAHNEILHYWVELGFAAPVLFVLWAVNAFRSSDIVIKAGLVACISVSVTYFALHNPVLGFLIATWVAVLTIKGEGFDVFTNYFSDFGRYICGLRAYRRTVDSAQ